MMLDTPAKMQGQNSDQRLGLMFGLTMQKSWAEVFHVESLANIYPFARIVEFGTGSGAVTLYLGLLGATKNIRVISYDIGSKRVEQKINYKTIDLFGVIGVRYIQTNVFDCIDEIGEIIGSPGMTLLYLDNGDKKKELDTFAPFLKAGDIALIHDYPSEITGIDLEILEYKHGLKKIHRDELLRYNTLHVLEQKL